MSQLGQPYIHALRFSSLNALYDPLVALTTREATFKRALLDSARLQPGARVLDVGCGTGTLAILAKRREPLICMSAIDGDPAILQRARIKSEQAHANIAYQVALSHTLPYPDGQFDCVLSSLFFHHLTLADKQRTLREISRVSGDRASLHVADWGKPQNPLMRAAFLTVQLLDGFSTTSSNVQGQLPSLIADAGFQGVEVVREIATLFGTLAIYRASKNA